MDNKIISSYDLEKEILRACIKGDIEKLTYFHKNNADLHFRNEEALSKACQHNKLEVIQFLIDKGADVLAANSWAMEKASGYGQIEAVKLLIKNGATIAHDNYAPVIISIEQNDIELFKYFLIECKIDLQLYHNQFIQKIVSYGNLNMLKYLEQLGVNVNADEDAALYYAACNAQLEIMDYLLEKNADSKRIYNSDNIESIKWYEIWSLSKKLNHELNVSQIEKKKSKI